MTNSIQVLNDSTFLCAGVISEEESASPTSPVGTSGSCTSITPPGESNSKAAAAVAALSFSAVSTIMRSRGSGRGEGLAESGSDALAADQVAASAANSPQGIWIIWVQFSAP
ncbi:uncharacterized protein METZ01_LOCUS106900 [marine metagenome]|uniref:Uncharacterized protein n=1 Tax=marine metagenome TaxID=408172 RepID=A0A381WNE3_9ZZZZ